MIKQGNSDTYPEMIIISNDLYQIRYNIKKITKEDELKGKHTSYNYDYIELSEISDSNIDAELKKNGIEKDEDRNEKSKVRPEPHRLCNRFRFGGIRNIRSIRWR